VCSAILKIFGLTPEREPEIKKFILIFYCIGIAGMLIPYSSAFFKMLTPYTLVLMAVLLIAYHRGSEDLKSLFIFFMIFMASFIIEALGVNTGTIFGHYRYGSSLGVKLFNTPVIIGLNWALLTYITASIFEKYSFSGIYKILLASMAMLAYDIILEQVAPSLNMWHWQNNKAPLQNYLAWFIIAIAFHAVFRLFKIKTLNNLSIYLYSSQVIFFIILSFFL
jgi:putative membrane protein